MNVIVTGSVSYDYIMDFPGRFADRIMPDKIHNLSLSFLVDTLNKQFGGTAVNIAYTLKLLGIEPTIVACAGADFSLLHEFLNKQKISTQRIRIHKDISTSSYFVITDQDDNQIGSFYRGAMKRADELSIKSYGKLLADTGNQRIKGYHLLNGQPVFTVISPNDPKAMRKYVKECRQLQLPYLYDPAFQIATCSSHELEEGIIGANILTGNDYEIALIEKKLGITHKILLKLVPIVITTCGARGSIIEFNQQSIRINPAKPKNVSDPTGAGDAFRAGFLAGYLRNFDLHTCGQMGSVSAVYTVEKYGTVTHRFNKRQFIKRYKENFNETIRLY